LDSAPNPVGGAYNAPDPLAGFKKPTSKGREGAMKGKRKGEDRRREGRGGEGKGRGLPSIPPVLNLPLHY